MRRRHPLSTHVRRFRSWHNRVLLGVWAVLLVGVAWMLLNVALLGAAELIGFSTGAALIASGIAASLVFVAAVVRVCRVCMLVDETARTIVAVNLFARVTLHVADIVSARVVAFPPPRRLRGTGSCPVLEVRTRSGEIVQLLATAISSRRSRIAALEFLRRAGISPLPTRYEYVDLAYDPQVWSNGRPRRRRR